MASPRLLEFKRRADKIPSKTYVMSVNTSRYANMEIPRTQSKAMESAQWEGRLAPPRPIWKDLLAGVFLLIFLYIIAIFF